MSDLKITQFDTATIRATTDIVPIVINPASSPANRKITIADFLGTNLTQIAALDQSSNSGKFLTTDGTSFSLVSLVGVTDGDKGDIVVSSSGTVWTVDTGAITSPKIADDAITSQKIANNAITNPKIADNAVTTPKIADNAITTLKLANDAVTSAKIANNAITSPKITDGAVTNAKLANVATGTFKGRISAGSGQPEDLTGTEATALLDIFTSSLKGLVPASGGNTTHFLRADGTWAAPGFALPFSGTNSFRTTIIDHGEIRLLFDDQNTYNYTTALSGGDPSYGPYLYIEDKSSGHTSEIKPNSISMFYNDWSFLISQGRYLRFEDTNIEAESEIYANYMKIRNTNTEEELTISADQVSIRDPNANKELDISVNQVLIRDPNASRELEISADWVLIQAPNLGKWLRIFVDRIQVEDTNAGERLDIFADRIEIGGSQVLGSQQPAIADLNVGESLDDTITKVNEILAMLRTHGLIES